MNKTIALLISLLAAACAATPVSTVTQSSPADLPVAQPPYRTVQASWKQRLAQPYVYVEMTGSYTQIGEALSAVHAAAQEQDLNVTGAPFALYYDDPGMVAPDELYARACLPVEQLVEVGAPLSCAMLESTTVVYAFVGGAYPDVPRAYPGLFSYMRSMNWEDAGPIRETYLVHPGEVEDFAELVCEVQIPATNAR